MTPPRRPLTKRDIAGLALREAAIHGLEILQTLDCSGSPGDTADDLRIAIDSYSEAMKDFIVTIRTSDKPKPKYFDAIAASASDAYAAAELRTGDAPYAISVLPAPRHRAPLLPPDRAALESAHRSLQVKPTLDEALQDKTLSPILRIVAGRAMKRRQRVDHKMLAANDID